MTVLITAGGTTEKIDEVRNITNSSTGAMGRTIAEAFLSFGEVTKILYVCGAAAMVPPVCDKVQIFRVTDVKSLAERLKQLLAREEVDGIVHCMAVSDYTVSKVTSSSILKEELSGDISRLDEALHGEGGLDLSRKISSEMEDLVLVLKKTPKIIAMLRPLKPRAVLVGFKLLDRVPEEALIEAGLSLLRRNGCDFVFANDKQKVTSQSHGGYLISADGAWEEISGREEIAGRIAERVRNKILLGRKGEA